MATNGTRPTKAERLDAARDKARAAREAEERRQQRSLWTKIGIIALVVLLVVAGGFWYYFGVVKPNNTAADQGPIPTNGNAYGGVTLNSPTSVVPTTGGGTVDVTPLKDVKGTPGATPSPEGVNKTAKPAQIIVFADALCPHCAEFENTYGPQLEKWLGDKQVTVEYRMVSVISSSTNYPARAANALYCVADSKPEAFQSTVKALFADQKERNNAALAQLASDNGAPGLEGCIDNGTFRPYAAYSQGLFNKASIGGTPSVFINGEYWDMQANGDFKAWAEPLITAANK